MPRVYTTFESPTQSVHVDAFESVSARALGVGGARVTVNLKLGSSVDVFLTIEHARILAAQILHEVDDLRLRHVSQPSDGVSPHA